MFIWVFAVHMPQNAFSRDDTHPFLFKVTGYTSWVFCQFYKGDNFCGFLFVFLQTTSHLKNGSTLKEITLLPKGVDPFQKGYKTVLTEMPPPERVSFALKLQLHNLCSSARFHGQLSLTRHVTQN